MDNSLIPPIQFDEHSNDADQKTPIVVAVAAAMQPQSQPQPQPPSTAPGGPQGLQGSQGSQGLQISQGPAGQQAEVAKKPKKVANKKTLSQPKTIPGSDNNNMQQYLQQPLPPLLANATSQQYLQPQPQQLLVSGQPQQYLQPQVQQPLLATNTPQQYQPMLQYYIPGNPTPQTQPTYCPYCGNLALQNSAFLARSCSFPQLQGPQQVQAQQVQVPQQVQVQLQASQQVQQKKKSRPKAAAPDDVANTTTTTTQAPKKKRTIKKELTPDIIERYTKRISLLPDSKFKELENCWIEDFGLPRIMADGAAIHPAKALLSACLSRNIKLAGFIDAAKDKPVDILKTNGLVEEELDKARKICFIGTPMGVGRIDRHKTTRAHDFQLKYEDKSGKVKKASAARGGRAVRAGAAGTGSAAGAAGTGSAAGPASAAGAASASAADEASEEQDVIDPDELDMGDQD